MKPWGLRPRTEEGVMVMEKESEEEISGSGVEAGSMKKEPERPVAVIGAGPEIEPVLEVTRMTLPEEEPLLGLKAEMEL